jgi:hypothetical protein
MTRHLADAMGIPHLDDLLKAENVLPPEKHISSMDAQLERQQMALADARRSADNIALSGQDHADRTDKIHDETFDNAQKVMDLGFNIDPARAPRMFEVATGLFKVALDAANSKRDAQLKAEKLILDRMKLDMDRRIAGEDVPADGAIETKAVVVEDRNELIKRLREEARAEKEALDALAAEQKALAKAAEAAAIENGSK